MAPSIFLSHTHADKDFVRRLARDLDSHGVKHWLDDAEIRVGESLIEKIREGIDNVDYVAVILSPDSVNSEWVKREVDVAMTQEINGKRLKVLPLMYRRCDPPGFLLGKLYVDFTDEAFYSKAFAKLVTSLGVVFNSKALDPQFDAANLQHSLDKALLEGLPLLVRPFHRPFQYIGMSVAAAEKAVGQQANEAGNILLDTEDCHMLLEAEGNFISYVDIEFKKTAPRYQNVEFDSEPILGALSISPAELELVRKATHCHTYYDHRKKLKITIACLYDGGPLSAGFGSKYYGQ